MLTLPWWTWLLAGLVLMAAELLVTSGFFLFFFGVGALVTSVVALAAGMTANSFLASAVFQGIAFLLISVLCIALLRKPLLARIHFRNQHPAVNSLIGQTAKALEAIVPQGVGKVELHGSAWSALNTGAAPIPAGAPCRVHKIEGLTLHVTL